MADVTALISDRVLYERLRSALAGRYTVRAVHAADDLWVALRNHSTALVVIETGPRVFGDVAAIVRTVRVRYPTLPVVAYCRVRRELSGEVLDLARAGVHDLLFVGVDDDRARLASLVGHAAQRSVASDVATRALAAGVALTALPFLRAFLDAAARPLSVQRIAGALSIHRRTLFARLAAARLPAPQILGAWCRLLVAARLLNDPTATVERVAHDLGFASANAFRNMMRRHAQLSPTTLRERGGYPYLRDRFIADLTGLTADRRRGVARRSPRQSAARGL